MTDNLNINFVPKHKRSLVAAIVRALRFRSFIYVLETVSSKPNICVETEALLRAYLRFD